MASSVTASADVNPVSSTAESGVSATAASAPPPAHTAATSSHDQDEQEQVATEEVGAVDPTTLDEHWSGLLYFNKDDERFFVPKRRRWMGWTVSAVLVCCLRVCESLCGGKAAHPPVAAVWNHQINLGHKYSSAAVLSAIVVPVAAVVAKKHGCMPAVNLKGFWSK